MNLYVIVPMYNEEKYISVLLDQLLLLRETDTFGVVFCDNTSKDGTRNLVESYIREHDLKDWHVVTESIKGTGAAARAAAAAAIELGATHLARTDADCVPALNWIERIKYHFNTSGDLLLAGHISCREDEGLSRPYLLWINAIADLTNQMSRVHYRKRAGEKYLGPHMMLTGGNMAIETELYKQTGGFLPSSIETNHEDLELVRAVRLLTTRYSYHRDIEVAMSSRRIRRWGIVRTLKWYTDHSWRPAAGETADIR